MTVVLAERLKMLRTERNFTQDLISKRISISRSMIASYELGVRQPSLEVLVSLARLYRVSTDYLLGVEDTRPIVIYGLDERQAAVINEMADLLADNTQVKRITTIKEAI